MEDETKSESDSESKSVGDCLDMGKEPQGFDLQIRDNTERSDNVSEG